MNDSFEQSRTALRSLLGLSDPSAPAGRGTFPRSKVMRLLLDPRTRGLALTAGALVAMAFPRVSRLGLASRWLPQLVRIGRGLVRRTPWH